MLKIIGWTLCLYLAFKFGHWMVTPKARYNGTETTLVDRARAGEPWFLIAAIVVVALFTTYTSWWRHKFAKGEYEYSKSCYAKIMAARHLPALPGKFGSFEAATAARGYYKFAQIHGLQLEMRKDDIDDKLNQARIGYSDYYTALATKNAPQKIAASFKDLERCLKGDGAPRGELLNP